MGQMKTPGVYIVETQPRITSMFEHILRSLIKTIIKRVAEGFAEITVALGILNNKITVVENEYTVKFEALDALTAKVDTFVPPAFYAMNDTELQAAIDQMVSDEIALLTDVSVISTDNANSGSPISGGNTITNIDGVTVVIGNNGPVSVTPNNLPSDS